MNNISDNILYLGCDDTGIDLFEAQYPVPDGISYNSYIIMDEQITVMDTVDAHCSDIWLHQLEEALNGRAPSYLVISHMEPDHAGSIDRIMTAYPEMKLVGNAQTFKMLAQFYPGLAIEGRCVAVKEGEELSLGAHKLRFYMAPMVHWPEVMVAYEESEQVLFSADAFGRFGALARPLADWDCEARRYYFNIVGKYGMQVQALLKKAEALDIRTIAPLHGAVLRGDLSHYIGLYRTWSSYEPEERGVLIAYASVYGHTRMAAELLHSKLEGAGVKAVLMDLARCDLSEAVEDAFRYDRLVIASPTIDGGLFPTVETFVHMLRAHNYQNRAVALIENGTWAPMSAKLLRSEFEAMKNITVMEETVAIRSAVNKESESQIDALASKLAQ